MSTRQRQRPAGDSATVKHRTPRGKNSPISPYLWKHTKTGYYYIIYVSAEGKKSRQTTGTRNPDEAADQLQRLKGLLTAPKPPPEPTIGAILDGYIQAGGKRGEFASPETARHTAAALKAFFAPFLPGDISTPLMKRYSVHRGKKPATIAREVQILRAALRWAVAERWITAAPTVPMPVRGTPPRDRWLTRDEADRLVASCDAPHVRLFVILALNTAKRSGAILGLRWGDIRDGMIDFGHARGNKRRGSVPMNEAVRRALDEARELATTQYVIQYRDDRVRSIKNGFKAACRRAGIEGVTPHILRHTAATRLAMAGVSMDEISRLLGASIAITERTYAKYHPDYLRRAVDALSAG